MTLYSTRQHYLSQCLNGPDVLLVHCRSADHDVKDAIGHAMVGHVFDTFHKLLLGLWILDPFKVADILVDSCSMYMSPYVCHRMHVTICVFAYECLHMNVSFL